MFEHMRNYGELLRRVSSWSRPGALLFVHVFAHSRFAYPFFEVSDASNWMEEHFFTGGLMPSDDLLLHLQDHFRIRERWRSSGVHYQRTSEAWLAKLDQHREDVLALFGEVYGKTDATRWLVRWRVFFMACAELFGYARGQEWMVSHYLFENLAGPKPAGGVFSYVDGTYVATSMISILARGDTMPALKGEFLTGKPVVLPDAASGRVALLAMGFTYNSRFAVEAWIGRFRNDFGDNPQVTFYEIPSIGGMARLGKWFIGSVVSNK